MGYVINYKKWVILRHIRRIKRLIRENPDNESLKIESENFRKDLELPQP